MKLCLGQAKLASMPAGGGAAPAAAAAAAPAGGAAPAKGKFHVYTTYNYELMLFLL
jgi:hypothetical protein